MNILFVAYSCSPYGGSEEALGWSIPYAFSKSDNVIVVTKKEHQEAINKFKLENECNMEFYYVDILNIFKKIYKGPLQSGKLNIWNKKAYKVVKNICMNRSIDIIHQINPVEFRSIGPFYNIKNTKFVVGPLGGGEYMPNTLKTYLTVKEKCLENIRLIVNKWVLFKLKFKKVGKKIDLVYYANNETHDYLKSLKIKNEIIMTEIGNSNVGIVPKERTFDEVFNFIVCGRLNYRKGHLLLLDALKTIPSEYKYNVFILGAGDKKVDIEFKIKEYDLESKVHLLGRVPHDKMNDYYKKANAFIMPSLRETTGMVVLEALSNGLPIISGNAYGVKIVCNEYNSLLYSLDGSKEDIAKSIADKMIYAMNNKIVLEDMSISAMKYSNDFTWDKKIEIYRKDYNKLINKDL